LLPGCGNVVLSEIRRLIMMMMMMMMIETRAIGEDQSYDDIAKTRKLLNVELQI
jgi:hypothetical protein